MKRLVVCILAFLSCLAGIDAQQASPVDVEGIARFDKTIHDFGDFLLSDGPKTCSFSVKNIGERPFAILQVVSSCGCTDVSWTKSPVRVGESGVISATYSNDQGAYPFEKTLTVYVSSLSKPVILRLRGNVTEKKKPLSELYPEHLGPLGLKETVFKIGNINQGGSRSDFALVANIGRQPMKIRFSGVSEHLDIKAEPEVIAPGATGKIVFTVHASSGLWGKNWYSATPVIDGKQYRPLQFWAFTKEDFSGWTQEQKDKAAQPMAESSTFSFGKVKAGTRVEAVFSIRNDGKSLLRIYKADSDNPAARPGSLPSLAAGEKGTFNVSLDTAGLPKGEALVIVTLTTNSPLRPIVNLFISGAVE